VTFDVKRAREMVEAYQEARANGELPSLMIVAGQLPAALDRIAELEQITLAQDQCIGNLRNEIARLERLVAIRQSASGEGK
jgi:hypothetical protein